MTKDGIGPCIAVSMKGSLNAFRDLTNRLEEAVGDCTNIHIAYPALVYGFMHVGHANRHNDRTRVDSGCPRERRGEVGSYAQITYWRERRTRLTDAMRAVRCFAKR